MLSPLYEEFRWFKTTIRANWSFNWKSKGKLCYLKCSNLKIYCSYKTLLYVIFLLGYGYTYTLRYIYIYIYICVCVCAPECVCVTVTHITMCVCVCIYIYIYIYIYISSIDTVSLYQNASVWLDVRDTSSWNRNPADLSSVGHRMCACVCMGVDVCMCVDACFILHLVRHITT